jgi:hypothetical protein
LFEALQATPEQSDEVELRRRASAPRQKSRRGR